MANLEEHAAAENARLSSLPQESQNTNEKEDILPGLKEHLNRVLDDPNNVGSLDVLHMHMKDKPDETTYKNNLSTLKKTGFEDPVFKKLSKLNGEVNRLTKEEAQEQLKKFGLDSRGKKDVLQKRLKAYYKRQQLAAANVRDPSSTLHYYDYLVVIDFEATCEEHKQNFRHEIIEFPAVLLSTSTRSTVGEFHSYVRPQLNPKLSDFCTSLTGITQDKVNAAPFFSEALKSFDLWLVKHKLLCDRKNFAIVTDGPWDMGRFMLHQCKISNIEFPTWAKKWINIRKSYSNFYNSKRVGLQEMLSKLGMTFQGRPHCGIDDTRNIARITAKLLMDGAKLRVNERIHLRKNGMPGPGEKAIHSITRREFDRFKKIQDVKLSDSDNSGDESCGELQEITEDYLKKLEGEHRPSNEFQLSSFVCNPDEFPDLM